MTWPSRGTDSERNTATLPYSASAFVCVRVCRTGHDGDTTGSSKFNGDLTLPLPVPVPVQAEGERRLGPMPVLATQWHVTMTRTRSVQSLSRRLKFKAFKVLSASEIPSCH